MALREFALRCLPLVVAALPLAATAAEPPPPSVITGNNDHPLTGKVFDTAAGRFIETSNLVARALAADALLLGETHDNPDHHALQAWMVRRMVEGGRRPAVAFEMIHRGQRDAMERHLADRPGDAEGLGAALEWEKSGWPDWSHYRPIAEAALAAGRAPLPANLSRDETRKIAREEAPELAEELALDRMPTQGPAAQSMAEEIKAGHCDLLPETAVPSMVRVQYARDAVMARAMKTGLEEGRQAVLIAGSGHVRTDRGVPWHLGRLAPQATILAVAFVEVKDGEMDPAAYGGDTLPVHIAVFTPRQEREDQCESLRRHMEKKEKK